MDKQALAYHAHMRKVAKETKAESEGDIVEQTCLECYEIRPVNKWMGVCKDCFNRVWVPALGGRPTAPPTAPPGGQGEER